MQILFLVLKIIGIVLAVILAIVLLLLIVPCRYRCKGIFEEENNVVLKVRSFLSILTVKCIYQDELSYKVKFLGIPIAKGTLLDDEDDEEYSSEVEKFEQYDKSVKTNELSKKEKKQRNQNSDYLDDIIFDEVEEESVKEKESVLEKIKGLFSKIKKILVTLKDVKRKIKELISFVKSKEFKEFLAYAFDIIKKIALHIKPKKLYADVEFGFDTPDKTGKTLAVIGVLSTVVEIDPEKFNIMPNFEEKKIEGKFFFKGRFVLIYLLILAIKVYFKKGIFDKISNIIKE